jgi:CheY-like chemotaxis protein
VARSRRKKSQPPLILVVEDEPTVRALAESIIEDQGFRTLSAANAKEALALFDGKSAPITVLFTDIQLPDGTAAALDGVELARRAVDLQPGLRVIYTSGGAQTDGITALFVEGAVFLPKPYTREQLIEALGSPGDQKTAPPT